MSNRVLASLENSYGDYCVDIFVRADGSFGFEEYRSESDGSARWQSLGKYSHLSFVFGHEALHEAQQRVAWLENTGPWRW